MQDRHLFKGKVDQSKEKSPYNWIVGFYYESQAPMWKGVPIIQVIQKDSAISSHLPIIPNTLSTCTGLRDKNKTLIFEEDIIHDKGESWAVYWDNELSHYGIRNMLDGEVSRLETVSVDVVVTGNIHDKER